MARRLAAAMISLAFVGAGCGSHGGGADSVSQYINQVNAIERGLTIPLADVSVRNRELNTGKKLETMQPGLAKSARTIRTLERRLDALQPPPAAVRLDALLRRLVHEQWRLANELALLAGYVRAAQPVLASAAAA